MNCTGKQMFDYAVMNCNKKNSFKIGKLCVSLLTFVVDIGFGQGEIRAMTTIQRSSGPPVHPTCLVGQCLDVEFQS